MLLKAVKNTIANYKNTAIDNKPVKIDSDKYP